MSIAYSNIVFIPGQRYDLKGSRNQITITGEYAGMDADGNYIFKNKKWFNAKSNYRFDIPDSSNAYSKEDMRELCATPCKQ